ncbi:MAG: hypothetical protein ACOZCL_14975 [Bacillota bacterium]
MGELKVIEEEIKVFENLIYFEKEVSNPRVMKNEIDALVDKLSQMKILHTHRVISRVISKDLIKKTVNMLIMIPIKDAAGVERFLQKHGQYGFMPKYELRESYRISIPNDMTDFRKAVEKFVEYSNSDSINSFDLKNNHVIEIAKIDMGGNVLGFDLHLEKINNGGNEDVNFK